MNPRPTGRAGTRLAVVVATTTVGLVISVLLAGSASAHAVLERSSPADGARVDVEPAAVSLTFDEAVQPIPAFDEVISSTAVRADNGRLQQSADGATITLPLRPGLPKGSYTTVWRVVSADTHVVSGSITFGLGVDPSIVPDTPADATSALDVAADVAQGLVYAGVVLLLGLAAAAALWWPWALAVRRLRIAARTGWLLTTVGTALALLLQGPRAADVDWAGVWRFTDVDQTLGEAFGWELIARLILLVLVAPLLTRSWLPGLRRRGRAITGAAAAVALLLTVALTGHESVGSAVPLAMTAAMLHLVAMTVWLGGVVTLAVVVLPATRAGGPHQASAASLRRWSVTAYGCVAALVVTGEYQASRQLAPVQALWSTSYGLALLVKLALIAVMLAAAALAQRRIQRLAPDRDRFAHGDVATMVARSVRVESTLAVLVLAVTAVLVSQPPGNTTYGPPVTLTAPSGPDTVRIRVDSTLHGREQFAFEIVDAAGRPAPVESITATLSSPTVAALAVKVAPAVPATDGRWSGWRSAAVAVPEAGVWTLNVDVGIDQADAYATLARYQVW